MKIIFFPLPDRQMNMIKGLQRVTNSRILDALFYSKQPEKSVACDLKSTYLVPNSANRKAKRCFGCLCKLQSNK